MKDNSNTRPQNVLPWIYTDVPYSAKSFKGLNFCKSAIFEDFVEIISQIHCTRMLHTMLCVKSFHLNIFMNG